MCADSQDLEDPCEVRLEERPELRRRQHGLLHGTHQRRFILTHAKVMGPHGATRARRKRSRRNDRSGEVMQ